VTSSTMTQDKITGASRTRKGGVRRAFKSWPIGIIRLNLEEIWRREKNKRILGNRLSVSSWISLS
jgi:hypothetical protein